MRQLWGYARGVPRLTRHPNPLGIRPPGGFFMLDGRVDWIRSSLGVISSF